jgi:hypothetical protein
MVLFEKKFAQRRRDAKTAKEEKKGMKVKSS